MAFALYISASRVSCIVLWKDNIVVVGLYTGATLGINVGVSRWYKSITFEIGHYPALLADNVIGSNINAPWSQPFVFLAGGYCYRLFSSRICDGGSMGVFAKLALLDWHKSRAALSRRIRYHRSLS